MMKKAIIFLGIVFSWLFSGCYEDKGNYDYIEVNEVTVTVKPEGTYTIYGYLGEELTVAPRLTFQNPSDTLEFDYTWKLDTTVISHERVLKYTHEGVCKIYALDLFVTDRKSGQVYTGSVSLQIDSPYKYGFALLTEKSNGATELHFLRLEKPENSPYYYTPFYNLYSSLYPDDPLGRKPFYIAENFTTPNKGGDELTILQKEGGCVSLNGALLNKEVALEDEFYGGYPEGVYPKLLAFCSSIDVMIGDDGKAYSRYIYPKATQPDGFHLARFMSIPFDFDKANTYIDRIIPAHFWAGLLLMHDKANNRFVAISTNGDPTSGKQCEIQDNSANSDEFVNLTNFGEYSLVWVTTYEDGAYGSGNYRCVFKKGDEFYVQNFTLAKQYSSTNINLSNKGKWRFEGSDKVSDRTVYALQRNGKYMYFAEGKSLYCCEFRNETGGMRQIVYPIHDFDRNVTHLTRDYNGERLLIALEGGKFFIFHSIDQVLGSPDPWAAGNMYESPDDVDLGEIKQVIFKYGNFSNSSGSSAPW
ncbi:MULTISPECIES: PKD-like family lipoprotein [Butyricimonas]|uniref:PKD-like family lipoprotein n=1 Tax=Butyricimonas TaxID=574697 RepID=UPI001CA36E97|nr:MULTISPECIES: PKD-like family lipoprotein [Butyricimonas]